MEESVPKLRFLVLRVPNSGLRALAGGPNDFASLEEAEARVAEIKSTHLIEHHTDLDIMRYRGDRDSALEEAGVLF